MARIDQMPLLIDDDPFELSESPASTSRYTVPSLHVLKSERRSDWQSTWSTRQFKTIALHLSIFLIYTVAFIAVTIYPSFAQDWCEERQALVYSPAIADGAVQFTTQKVDGLLSDSILAGYPNEQSDVAWHNLMKGINLRITKEEMRQVGGTESLELADGSGYLAVLGVYHELHCIKRIRKYIFRDYYYPNSTANEERERITHAEHCLELIRQAAICHGDTTISSFKWLDTDDRIEPTTREGAMHTCVDWTALSSWAEKRAVDLFDPDLLKAPLQRPSHIPRVT